MKGAPLFSHDWSALSNWGCVVREQMLQLPKSSPIGDDDLLAGLQLLADVTGEALPVVNAQLLQPCQIHPPARMYAAVFLHSLHLRSDAMALASKPWLRPMS